MVRLLVYLPPDLYMVQYSYQSINTNHKDLYMTNYIIGIGMLLGLLAVGYIDYTNYSHSRSYSEAKVDNYIAILQAAANSDDPVLLKEAEVVRGELIKIEVNNEAAQADKLNEAGEQAGNQYYKVSSKQAVSILTGIIMLLMASVFAVMSMSDYKFNQKYRMWR